MGQSVLHRRRVLVFTYQHVERSAADPRGSPVAGGEAVGEHVVPGPLDAPRRLAGGAMGHLEAGGEVDVHLRQRCRQRVVGVLQQRIQQDLRQRDARERGPRLGGVARGDVEPLGGAGFGRCARQCPTRPPARWQTRRTRVGGFFGFARRRVSRGRRLPAHRRGAEHLFHLGRVGGQDEVIVAADLEHLAAEHLVTGVAEQEQPALGGKFAQLPDRRLRPALDRLGGGDDGRIGVVRRFGRQLGDPVEQRLDARQPRAGRGLGQRPLQLTPRVADQQETFGGETEHNQISRAESIARRCADFMVRSGSPASASPARGAGPATRRR